MLVVFSRPRKFKIFSWLISKKIKKDYSHVCILGHSKDFSSWIITEASHGEVKPVEFANWLEKNNIVKSYQFTGEIEHGKLSWICRQFDKPYSFRAVLFLALNIRFNYDGDKSFICSELVSNFFDLSDREWMTPEDVEKKIGKDSRFRLT